MPSISFNGKTYNDLAEMPAAERQAYEQLMVHFKDENQDGIPDIFQGDVVSNIVNAVASTNIVVDGKRVGGFQNLTQEQRIKLERGMSMLQKLGVIQEMPNLDGVHLTPNNATAMPIWDNAERPQSTEEIKEDLPDWLNENIHPVVPGFAKNSAIQEEGVNLPVLLLVIGMVILAGVGILAFFWFQGGF
jgi:hypothetical protein